MNLFLIGYRGTGKTSLAPRVATRLGDGWTFADMDPWITERAGCSIRQLFETRGEESFRDLETEALRHFSSQDRTVVATGGGVVLRPQNREILRTGRCVWLRGNPKTLLERLDHDAQSHENRPALTHLDRAKEVETLLEQRRPLYEELAELTLDTDEASLDELADQIAEFARRHSGAPNPAGRPPERESGPGERA